MTSMSPAPSTGYHIPSPSPSLPMSYNAPSPASSIHSVMSNASTIQNVPSPAVYNGQSEAQMFEQQLLQEELGSGGDELNMLNMYLNTQQQNSGYRMDLHEDNLVPAYRLFSILISELLILVHGSSRSSPPPPSIPLTPLLNT